MLQVVTQLNSTVTIGRTKQHQLAPALAQVDPTCAVNTGAITLAPNAGSLYSLDGALTLLTLPVATQVLLPGSTHTVSEQNAAGCNSTAHL